MSGWQAGSTVSVYARVQSREPETGQQKVQVSKKTKYLLFQSVYIIYLWLYVIADFTFLNTVRQFMEFSFLFHSLFFYFSFYVFCHYVIIEHEAGSISVKNLKLKKTVSGNVILPKKLRLKQFLYIFLNK